jgi:hypothetical protein
MVSSRMTHTIPATGTNINSGLGERIIRRAPLADLL